MSGGLLANLRRLVRGHDHTCPRWLCFTFDNPIRRLLHDPMAIAGGLVWPGDRVLDLGPGTGFFTLPLADRVGLAGEVVAADIQPSMLDTVARRARRHGLANVRPVLLDHRGLAPHTHDAGGRFDFALLFWMLHEVDDRHALLRDLHTALVPDGRALVVEPRGHVPADLFEREMRAADDAGFQEVDRPRVAISRAALLRKRPVD